MNTSQLYSVYTDTLQKIADIKYASAVLQWDQETYLPPKGNAFRGRQIATLSEIAHEQFIKDDLGLLLKKLSDAKDLDEKQQKNVERTLEDYNKARRFTPEFIRKMSEAVNRSFHSWVKAKKQNDFSIFRDDLDAVIKLKREEASITGYSHHPYDALMNDYDRGLTVKITDNLFAGLKPGLTELLDKIKSRPQVDSSFLEQFYPKDKQWEFGLEILRRIHFDFEAGRQDISEHPFSTNFNSNDVRLTTRIDENDFGNMTWSCIHEGGHGLYEQGLPPDQYGLPLGEYCSLSIHESQSRLWENCVGRSKGFWKTNYPLLQNTFPQQLGKVSLDDFYKGINMVKPSFIRTEADELTYHFHVMIRYELEKLLIEGAINTDDIPAYWNEQYLKYLGVKVENDRMGCLQDVHWSHGSFGYFATYSLGSLYAAQFYAAILKENQSVKENTGEHTSDVLKWLRQHIHQYGRYYYSGDLCKKATGQELDSKYFITYATEKYSDIYLF